MKRFAVLFALLFSLVTLVSHPAHAQQEGAMQNETQPDDAQKPLITFMGNKTFLGSIINNVINIMPLTASGALGVASGYNIGKQTTDQLSIPLPFASQPTFNWFWTNAIFASMTYGKLSVLPYADWFPILMDAGLMAAVTNSAIAIVYFFDVKIAIGVVSGFLVAYLLEAGERSPIWHIKHLADNEVTEKN